MAKFDRRRINTEVISHTFSETEVTEILAAELLRRAKVGEVKPYATTRGYHTTRDGVGAGIDHCWKVEITIDHDLLPRAATEDRNG